MKTAHGTQQQFSALNQDNMNARMHKVPSTLTKFEWIPLSCCVHIPYSTKFSWVFNFVNFQPFATIFQRKFLTHGMQCACAANSQNYFNKIAIRKKIRPSKIYRYTVYIIINNTATHIPPWDCGLTHTRTYMYMYNCSSSCCIFHNHIGQNLVSKSHTCRSTHGLNI